MRVFSCILPVLSIQAALRTRVWPSIAALIGNGCLNYALIHGHFGLPQMGYLGSATATTITLWLAMGATAAVIHRVHIPGRLNGPVDWAVVRELAHLGWPIAVTMGVEIMLFMVASLMMGTMGNTTLAAHQVTLNEIGRAHV